LHRFGDGLGRIATRERSSRSRYKWRRPNRFWDCHRNAASGGGPLRGSLEYCSCRPTGDRWAERSANALARDGPRSLRFPWMKNRAFRPSPTPRPNRPPVPGKHPNVGRDHEYKRLGNMFHSRGHWTCMRAMLRARVERRHRSREFIALLNDLDQYYPADCTIRIVLDNHSAHISKRKPMLFWRPRPNRFQYVLTPKTWIVAQHRGDTLWQDGTHIPASYPRAFLGRTPCAHPTGNRRNQTRPPWFIVGRSLTPWLRPARILFNEAIY